MQIHEIITKHKLINQQKINKVAKYNQI